MNGLRARGVIGPRTRLVLETYRTSLQLVSTDHTHSGSRISRTEARVALLRRGPRGVGARAHHAGQRTSRGRALDFRAGVVDPVVDTTVHLRSPAGATADALVLSGVAGLFGGQDLGACNSFSGDKVLPLPGAGLTGRST